MEPLEDSLRQLYARKPPPPGFTARVMERVGREGHARKFPKFHWAMIGAVAASLLVGVFVKNERWVEDPPEATEAEAQLMLSLQLAGTKINKARDAVLRTAGGDSQ